MFWVRKNEAYDKQHKSDNCFLKNGGNEALAEAESRSDRLC